MSAPTEADMDALARALASLLASWWRRHAEQEEAPSGQEGAGDRDPRAANSRRADL